MVIFNGEDVAITLCSDGNDAVVIQPGGFADMKIDHIGKSNPDGRHNFGSDSFYVEEEGSWYGKFESCLSGADLEIYKK